MINFGSQRKPYSTEADLICNHDAYQSQHSNGQRNNLAYLRESGESVEHRAGYYWWEMNWSLGTYNGDIGSHVMWGEALTEDELYG